MQEFDDEGVLILKERLPSKMMDMDLLITTINDLKYYKYDCVGRFFIQEYPDTREYTWSKLRNYFLPRVHSLSLENPKNAFAYFSSRFEAAHRAFIYFKNHGLDRSSWPKYVLDWEEHLNNSKRRKKQLLQFLEVCNTNKDGQKFNSLNLLIIMPSNVIFNDSKQQNFNKLLDTVLKSSSFASIKRHFLYSSEVLEAEQEETINFEMLSNIPFKPKTGTLEELENIHQAYMYYKCFFPDNQKMWPLFVRIWNYVLFPEQKPDERSKEEMSTNFSDYNKVDQNYDYCAESKETTFLSLTEDGKSELKLTTTFNSGQRGLEKDANELKLNHNDQYLLENKRQKDPVFNNKATKNPSSKKKKKQKHDKTRKNYLKVKKSLANINKKVLKYRKRHTLEMCRLESLIQQSAIKHDLEAESSENPC